MSTGFVEPATQTLPLSERDEMLFEIINGERVDLPAMSIYAHLIAGRIFSHSKAFCERTRWGHL